MKKDSEAAEITLAADGTITINRNARTMETARALTATTFKHCRSQPSRTTSSCGLFSNTSPKRKRARSWAVLFG